MSHTVLSEWDGLFSCSSLSVIVTVANAGSCELMHAEKGQKAHISEQHEKLHMRKCTSHDQNGEGEGNDISVNVN